MVLGMVNGVWRVREMEGELSDGGEWELLEMGWLFSADVSSDVDVSYCVGEMEQGVSVESGINIHPGDRRGGDPVFVFSVSPWMDLVKQGRNVRAASPSPRCILIHDECSRSTLRRSAMWTAKTSPMPSSYSRMARSMASRRARLSDVRPKYVGVGWTSGRGAYSGRVRSRMEEEYGGSRRRRPVCRSDRLEKASRRAVSAQFSRGGRLSSPEDVRLISLPGGDSSSSEAFSTKGLIDQLYPGGVKERVEWKGNSWRVER